MGDMGDIFNDMRDMRRQHIAERVKAQVPFFEGLRARAIAVGSLPGGFRLVFRGAAGFNETFDYWPQRGKWFEHRSRKHRQGEAGLLRRLDELGVEHERIEADDAGLLRFIGKAA